MSGFNCSIHDVSKTEMKLKKYDRFTRLEIIVTDENGVEVSFTLFSNLDEFPLPSLEIEPAAQERKTK